MSQPDPVSRTDEPLVSVIIPVWNVEQHLPQCLDSLLAQTLPPESIEVLAVDDGSTDGSPAILDEYAGRFREMRVVHQANSGGPGAPRNVGLGLARGRYVFFLDADDYLGPEALSRLTDAAERNRSDVVLAKMVGVDGRPVPQAAFRRNRSRATLAQVYSSLSVLKLFRRSLIERLGLRFPEGLQGGEDAPFTIRAYLAADGISVVADYDCYYARFRVGSQSASGWKWGPELVGHLARMGERMDLVGTALPDGPERSALLARHVADLVRPFKPQWRRLDPEIRRAAFAEAAVHVQRWVDTDALRALPPWNAVRAWCLLQGNLEALFDIAELRPHHAAERAVVEGEQVYLGYPHFRDEVGIPDWCFEVSGWITPVVSGLHVSSGPDEVSVSGTAYLPLFGGRCEVVLNGPEGREVVLATTAAATPELRDRRAEYPLAAFAVRLDPVQVAREGLGTAPWTVSLRVATERVARTIPLPAAGARLDPAGPLRLGDGGALIWRRRARWPWDRRWR